MKQPETLLKHAVEKIVYKINKEHVEPHEAVVKVSKELDLNVNFIKRATEVINVALSYNHFKKNADQKEEDFPIVDSAKVASEIFGTKEKTAAELRSEWFPDTSFETEGINFSRLLTDPEYKAAYIKIATAPEKHVEFPTSMRGIFEKSADYLQKLEKEVDDLNTKKAGLNYDYTKNFSKLVEKFARDIVYRTPFEEFESQVYSSCGERAVPYLDLIYKTAQLSESRGVHDDKYQLFDACPETVMFGDFIKSVDDFTSITKQAADAEHNYKFEKEYITEAYHKLGESMKSANFGQMNTQEMVEAPNEQKHEVVSDDPVMTAAKAKMDRHKKEEKEPLDESVLSDAQKGLPHHLKRAIIRSKKKYASLDPKYKEAFDVLDNIRISEKTADSSIIKGIGDFHKALSNKAQEVSIPHSSLPSTSDEDNLDRKLLLQELMHADPVLSTVQPKRVADLYQQFLRLSPELSKEKEIVRGALRGMDASQALGVHEGQQMIETNTNLAKQRLLHEGRGVKKEQ